MRLYVLLATLTFIILSTRACKMHNGCKIMDQTCTCGWGCNTEYIFRTRRECREALKEALLPAPGPERNSNICSRVPCVRGICIQTTNDIGYICKCEGTGFYGQRCEKACPTSPIHGMVFPHECVVI